VILAALRAATAVTRALETVAVEAGLVTKVVLAAALDKTVLMVAAEVQLEWLSLSFSEAGMLAQAMDHLEVQVVVLVVEEEKEVLVVVVVTVLEAEAMEWEEDEEKDVNQETLEEVEEEEGAMETHEVIVLSLVE
jgi:hypothetical protein